MTTPTFVSQAGGQRAVSLEIGAVALAGDTVID
jgi:hypothetical protein